MSKYNYFFTVFFTNYLGQFPVTLFIYKFLSTINIKNVVPHLYFHSIGHDNSVRSPSCLVYYTNGLLGPRVTKISPQSKIS